MGTLDPNNDNPMYIDGTRYGNVFGCTDPEADNYDPDKLEYDKQLITEFYNNNGFPNFKFTSSIAQLITNKNSFEIILTLNEGNMFNFGSISAETKLDKLSTDAVIYLVSTKEGSMYQSNLIKESIAAIRDQASILGYTFIEVYPELIPNEETKTVDIKFNINEGPRVYVKKINITGNTRTIDKVIRRQVKISEGDAYNKYSIDLSSNTIKSLGYFSTVDIKEERVADKDRVNVNIHVEEKNTGEISAGAGYSSTSKTSVTFGLKEKNFLGKGINLNTNFELSEESLKGQFVFSKPNFNYTDNTLRTSIKALTTDNLEDYGYKQSETGFSIGTTYEQYENLFFSPELSLTLEDLTTNDSASSNLKKQQGQYEDFYFNYGLNYDLRDSTYNPKSGYKISFFQGLPVVSDNSEISNTFITTKYKTLNSSSGMVGKVSLYLKGVHSLTGDDVRISKRAYIPYSRLKGFEKRKVGPIDNNDYVGGNYVSTLNFSTNLPGLFQTVENVDLNYFVDIGNVWGVDYSDSIDNSNVIRSSTGFALELMTPVGPLTFSLSQPITKKSTDKTESFRFNLGTTF